MKTFLSLVTYNYSRITKLLFENKWKEFNEKFDSFNIKYYDSKSYTYLISKQSEISSNEKIYTIFDVHFHSFHPSKSIRPLLEMEGIHAVEN